MLHSAQILLALERLVLFCCLLLFFAASAWSGQATLPAELEAPQPAKKTSKKASRSSEDTPAPAPAAAVAPAPQTKDAAQSSNNGRFKRSASGVILDTSTNLEWFASVDLDYSSDMARAWAASLKEAGGGWRLPTRSELAGLLTDLFQTKSKVGKCEQPMPDGRCRKWTYTGAVEPVTCGRPGVIDWPQTCGNVWTSEQRDERTVWFFNFSNARMIWGGPHFQLNARALAVRARR